MSVKKIARLVPQNTATLICDVQECLKGILWEYSSVISVAGKMIKVSKLLGIPIVVSEHYPRDIDFRHTATELDTSSAALCIEKTKFSMYVPEVVNFLKKNNIKSILLLGIESHVCILQTALDFLENGYDVHVIADGVSSQNHSEIDIALTRMRSAGAIITTSDSVLFELIQDSKHEKFEDISNIVKEYMKANKSNKILQTTAGTNRELKEANY